jgi:hypothetical protein
MDQGVLNGVLGPLGKTSLLPVEYNAQTVFYDLGYDGLDTCRNPVWAYTKSAFDKGIQDPAIVHFTTCFLSGTRPWYHKDNHRYRNEYLAYRGMTPWAAEPLWADTTTPMKRTLTFVCNKIPRPLMQHGIRFLHAWAYPTVRGIRNQLRRRTKHEQLNIL